MSCVQQAHPTDTGWEGSREREQPPRVSGIGGGVPLWGGGGAPAFAGRGPHSSPAWARPSPTGTDAASPSQGLTAYHDISLDKCYVIELNTTIVLPPRNFWELLMNVKVSGVGGILSLPGRPALWRPGPGQSRALWRKAGAQGRGRPWHPRLALLHSFLLPRRFRLLLW